MTEIESISELSQALVAELAAAVNALSVYPVSCLGLNCATGPNEMSEHVAWLSRHRSSRRRINSR